jgi:hypothetical protein
MDALMTQKNIALPRYRPFGLSIAILLTVFIFGLAPIMPVIFIVSAFVRKHGWEFDPNFVGGTVGVAHIVLGFATLIVCLLAWIGRPVYIRWTFIFLTWIGAIASIYRIGVANQQTPCFNTACIQNLVYPTPLLVCSGLVVIVATAYVTWYTNRAPARNFFEK